jgi:hypothetical protein
MRAVTKRINQINKPNRMTNECSDLQLNSLIDPQTKTKKTGGDESGKKTARPTTARRRPPKLKNNVKETESRPGGGDVDDSATRPVGVMIEGQDDESEDEEDPLDDVMGGDNGPIGRTGSMDGK